MANDALHAAVNDLKAERVFRAARLLLDAGRVFESGFSGKLTMTVEIRNGGIQDLRLGREFRDQ